MGEQSYNARFKLPGNKNMKLRNRLRREKMSRNSTDEVVELVAVANLISVYIYIYIYIYVYIYTLCMLRNSALQNFDVVWTCIVAKYESLPYLKARYRPICHHKML
jgi:hypothetical protein